MSPEEQPGRPAAEAEEVTPDTGSPADAGVDAGPDAAEGAEPAEPAARAASAELADAPVPAEAESVGSERVGPADGEPAAAEPAEPAAPDEDLVAVGEGLPELTEHAALASALEALLLVVDSPASEESLASALDQPTERVEQTLQIMSAELTERRSGIDLRRVGEGWRFYTRDTFAPYVEKLLLDGQRSKLTRAALETLAVIAYRQPVTRSRVAAVRGVNVDGVIRTLLARGLIEESGADPETGGTLYVTTELFLERLGLSSLTDLPPIAPLLPEVDAIDDI